MQINSTVGILVVMLFSLIILEGTYSGLHVLSTMGSYSTGYQGARAQYCGVQWEGTQYTTSATHGASRARFDTTLSFDPDGGARDGVPNLEGEMSARAYKSQILYKATLIITG